MRQRRQPKRYLAKWNPVHVRKRDKPIPSPAKRGALLLIGENPPHADVGQNDGFFQVTALA